MQNIVESGRLKAQDAFRVGLVAYRDHPPQDNSYVSVSYAFTSDSSIVKDNLRKLYASGGLYIRLFRLALTLTRFLQVSIELCLPSAFLPFSDIGLAQVETAPKQSRPRCGWRCAWTGDRTRARWQFS